MAELVDALDSKSSSFGSAGSIPSPGTKASQFCGAFFMPFKVPPALALPGLHTFEALNGTGCSGADVYCRNYK